MDRRTITEFALRPSPFSTGTLTQPGLHNTEVEWKGRLVERVVYQLAGLRDFRVRHWTGKRR